MILALLERRTVLRDSGDDHHDEDDHHDQVFDDDHEQIDKDDDHDDIYECDDDLGSSGEEDCTEGFR